MGVYVAKKNKYLDYVFGSQAIEELICRTGVHAVCDKRTDMRNKYLELIFKTNI